MLQEPGSLGSTVALLLKHLRPTERGLRSALPSANLRQLLKISETRFLHR